MANADIKITAPLVKFPTYIWPSPAIKILRMIALRFVLASWYSLKLSAIKLGY
ncbi:MAG: hypothetical protein ACRD97_03405 [Nitrososphaeraceae archaeon]